MAEHNVDLRDIKFTLFDSLDLDPIFSSEKFGDYSPEDVEMILDEAHKFAREVMAPANRPGDEEGCTLEGGQVKVPQAYQTPYKLFCEGGWLALNHSADYGGQGSPQLLRTLADDMFFGANIALNLGILLTPGAAHMVEAFGSDALKELYVEKMYTGVWSGTMCLTEAQAGSDVGAVRTKATPKDDHYLIDGEKIFITFGDHDLTDNIIHLVLARIEGAPAGTKGISLFVVPKFLVNDDGSNGAANNVDCVNLEHKLGIHGSPTCTLTFGSSGESLGWLVGEPNKGMRYMFQMMNEARLSVGMQGGALANAAYQVALEYAKERPQGTLLSQMKDPNAGQTAIINHPDVQVMLAKQKAYAEGCRALLAYTSYAIDRTAVAKDDAEKQKYNSLVEILTPISKAYCTDIGFRVIELAIQTLGGYGYLKDYAPEQFLRDSKIASLYEGTNGIQAMDLVGRKLSMNGGANVIALAGLMNEFLQANSDHPGLKVQVEAVAKAVEAWNGVNGYFMKSVGAGNYMAPLYSATQYLSLCGDLLLGFFLVRQARVAWEKLAALCSDAGVDLNDGKALKKFAKTQADAQYFYNKIKTAQFFCASELVAVHSKAAAITSGDLSATQMVWSLDD
jgi:alkylation response protein AidB-like acyl-CoA dehydrogenase